MGISPGPIGVFFQVHGSKLKLHPVPYLSQASVSCISHSMLLLGSCKYALNGFLPCLVHPLVDGSVPGIVRKFFVLLPDVPGYYLGKILALGTKVSGRTVATDLWITFILTVTVTVGGAVLQNLKLWAVDAVKMLVIYILPPFVTALHCHGTLVGCG